VPVLQLRKACDPPTAMLRRSVLLQAAGALEPGKESAHALLARVAQPSGLSAISEDSERAASCSVSMQPQVDKLLVEQHVLRAGMARLRVALQHTAMPPAEMRCGDQ
jgi:hypothetical protein